MAIVRARDDSITLICREILQQSHGNPKINVIAVKPITKITRVERIAVTNANIYLPLTMVFLLMARVKYKVSSLAIKGFPAKILPNINDIESPDITFPEVINKITTIVANSTN